MGATDLHQVHFNWPYREPSAVVVTGSFDQWSSSLHLTKTPAGFEGSTNILWDCKITFKFVVDGEWCIREDEPTETDPGGFVNNVYVSPSKPDQLNIINEDVPLVGQAPEAVEAVQNGHAPNVVIEGVEEKSSNSMDLVSSYSTNKPSSCAYPQLLTDLADTIAARDGTSSALHYVASGLGAAVNGVVGIDPINTEQIAIPTPKPEDEFSLPNITQVLAPQVPSTGENETVSELTDTPLNDASVNSAPLVVTSPDDNKPSSEAVIESTLAFDTVNGNGLQATPAPGELIIDNTAHEDHVVPPTEPIFFEERLADVKVEELTRTNTVVQIEIAETPALENPALGENTDTQIESKIPIVGKQVANVKVEELNGMSSVVGQELTDTSTSNLVSEETVEPQKETEVVTIEDQASDVKVEEVTVAGEEMITNPTSIPIPTLVEPQAESDVPVVGDQLADVKMEEIIAVQVEMITIPSSIPVPGVVGPQAEPNVLAVGDNANNIKSDEVAGNFEGVIATPSPIPIASLEDKKEPEPIAEEKVAEEKDTNTSEVKDEIKIESTSEAKLIVEEKVADLSEVNNEADGSAPSPLHIESEPTGLTELTQSTDLVERVLEKQEAEKGDMIVGSSMFATNKEVISTVAIESATQIDKTPFPTIRNVPSTSGLPNNSPSSFKTNSVRKKKISLFGKLKNIFQSDKEKKAK